MKRFSKVLLILGFTAFFAVSCANNVEEAGSGSGDKKHFSLIKINSLNGSSDFATKPVAKHVKDSQMSWGDNTNKDAPDPYYEQCEIFLGDNKIGDGEVKVRGNWTTSYAKKSLRIKFGEKQEMLGLHGGKKYKNWVLLADFKDASLLRNAVAYKMYKKMFPDNYASDCQLVELEINGEYFGVYLLAEQQEAKRLGLTEPEKKATNTDIGYLMEFDSYYYTEENDNEIFTISHEQFGKLKNYANADLVIANPGYTIKSDINGQEQHDFIANYMNKLWEICYKAAYEKKYYKFNETNTDISEDTTIAGSSDDEKCKNCIKKIIDINSLADCYIFSELTCDPDLYYSSFYLNIDFGEGKDKKLRFDAPWDFDSTMGNKSFCVMTPTTDTKYCKTINDMYAGMGQTDVNVSGSNYANPWMVIFINQTWFQNLVKERWATIDQAEVRSYVNQYIDVNSGDTYLKAFEKNREKWEDPSGNDELCAASKTAAATSQKASAEYFKTWLNARFTALDTIISGL